VVTVIGELGEKEGKKCLNQDLLDYGITRISKRGKMGRWEKEEVEKLGR